MVKGADNQRFDKKKPKLTLKEKRQKKQEKREAKYQPSDISEI